jgi:hypothetical protein
MLISQRLQITVPEEQASFFDTEDAENHEGS